MAFFRSLIACLLLFKSAIALEAQIDPDSVSCKSHAVRTSFSSICNDNVCKFGQEEKFEGTLTYYGVVDHEGLNADDFVTLDATLKMNIAGKTSYQNILEKYEFPICNSNMTAVDNTECPADGDYSFSTVYQLPAPTNEWDAWRFSGFSGQVALKLYTDEEGIIGECYMDLTFRNSGISKYTPEAALVTYIGLGVLGVLAIAVFVTLGRKYKKKAADDDSSLYRKMEGTTTSRMAEIEEGRNKKPRSYWNRKIML